MREVGKRLGYMPYSLKRYFPQACLEITARHRTYLAERKSARERQMEDEVRRVVLSLIEQGEYPSKAQVARLLTNPAAMIGLKTRKVWRKILYELGFK